MGSLQSRDGDVLVYMYFWNAGAFISLESLSPAPRRTGRRTASSNLVSYSV